MNVMISNAIGAVTCAALLIFSASGCSEGPGERLAHAGGAAPPAAVVDTLLYSADVEDKDFGAVIQANRMGVPYLVAFDLEDLDDGHARRQRH